MFFIVIWIRDNNAWHIGGERKLSVEFDGFWAAGPKKIDDRSAERLNELEERVSSADRREKCEEREHACHVGDSFTLVEN